MPFIVVEGLNGAGKSTLASGLEKSLAERGVSLVCPRDPGSTMVAEGIRKLILQEASETPVPRAELLLYQAARAQLVEQIIRPALEKKDWVLCDRFYSSTIAFQSFARGLSNTDVNWLNEYAVKGVHPDLFLLVDLSVEECNKRMQKRKSLEEDRLETEANSFQEKVRQGYLHQAKCSPKKWLVLDGMRTPEELIADVLAELKRRKWLN